MNKGFYIPSLDGLRCFAVLLVFAGHVLQIANVPNIIPGSFGVTVFFFLSGYLITTLLRMEKAQTGAVSLSHFYLRRALRILPPFYLVLLLATLRGHYELFMRGTNMEGWYVVGQALHLTNFQIAAKGFDAPVAPGTLIYWSLAIEEHFYLVFPLIFLWLHRFGSARQQARVLMWLCAVVLAWRCWLIFGAGASYERTYAGTDTRFDSILFGCILGLWGNPMLDESRLGEKTWKWRLLPLGIAGIVISLVITSLNFTSTFRYTLQGISLFPIFVVAVRYPAWGPMKLLNIGWVKWIGLVSYSFYLVHFSMLRITNYLLQPDVLTLGLVGLPASFAVAAAIYYGVEKPCGRLRKKLSGTTSLPADASPIAARSVS